MKRHNRIMVELHDLLERMEAAPKSGKPASINSVRLMNSLLNSSVGLTRPQRLTFLEKLIGCFPNDPIIVPMVEGSQMTFTFISTKQLIQPVVSAVIDWMLVDAKYEVRPDAAEAITAVAYGGKEFPDD